MFDKFKIVCQVLNVGTVKVTDVVNIGDERLFRAKVVDDEKRRELLLVTNKTEIIEWG